MAPQDNAVAEEPIFNLFSPEFVRDPYPSYHLLRAQQPMYMTPLGFWVATRYEDVTQILRDKRFGKNFEGRMIEANGPEVFDNPAYGSMRHWMLMQNPPNHTRLRSLVAKAFTPRHLEALKPRIQSLVDELIDAVEDNGEMELINEFAYPLPLNVICDMLGIPVEDRVRFERGSRTSGRLIDPTPMTPDELEDANKGFLEQQEYFLGLIEERRRQPTDDLMTVLVQAEEEGDRLSEEELVANIILLFGAGHETTVNLIGNGMLALLSAPDQLDKLKRDLSLVPGAVEEMLRFDSSVQLTSRTVFEDTEIGGVMVKAGETVMTLLGAANRDPENYDKPDEFDVTRQNVRPTSFGGGVHHCIGAPLARIEAQSALETLLRRLPGIRAVGAGDADWRPTFTLRGLKSLPVVW